MYEANQDVQTMYGGDGQAPAPAQALEPGIEAENGMERKLLPPRHREKLRSERVQDELRKDLLDSRLALLPGWRLKVDGVMVGRIYELPDPQVALSFANFVGEFARSEKLNVGLTIHRQRVGIALPARMSDLRMADLLHETMAFVQTMD